MLYSPEKEGVSYQQFTNLLKRLPEIPLFYIGTDKYKLKHISDKILINQVQTRLHQIREYLMAKVPEYFKQYTKDDHDKLIYTYVSIDKGQATLEYYISLPHPVVPKQKLYKLYSDIIKTLSASSVALYYDEYTEEVLDLHRVMEVCHEKSKNHTTKGLIVQEHAAGVF